MAAGWGTPHRSDGSCLCDGRYPGCTHQGRCGQPNDGTGRGPWCAGCNTRRLAALTGALDGLVADLDQRPAP